MESNLKTCKIPTLATERFILRPFDENDLQAIFDIYSDEEVNTFLAWYPVKTMKEAEEFFRSIMSIVRTMLGQST